MSSPAVEAAGNVVDVDAMVIEHLDIVCRVVDYHLVLRQVAFPSADVF